MDLTAVERRLRGSADVLLVDPRFLRHIIKRDRDLVGTVPHSRCYAVEKQRLHRLGIDRELHLHLDSGRHWVLLVARPSPTVLKKLPREDVARWVLRAAFHARVHMELEQRILAGELDELAVRHRVEALGRTEFEEIRSALTHDDLLLPPRTDQSVYVEFCAVYLELREFSPGLLVTTFPGLTDYEAADAVVAEDVSVETLLDEREAHDAPRSMRPSSVRAPSTARPAPPLSTSGHARLLRASARASTRSDHVRSARLAARATAIGDPESRARAELALRSAIGMLCARIDTALKGHQSLHPESFSQWHELLTMLVQRSLDRPRALARGPEERTLILLQRAVAAYEQPGVIVDVPSWIRTAGRRPVVRPRVATRELQVAALMERAAEQVQSARLPHGTLAQLTQLVEEATHRATQNVRSALRPQIGNVLRRVGLIATSGPERQARQKLVEELLDRILERGFLSLPHLRDAISRNEIKLRDLSSLAEFAAGDPLLMADAQLDVVLDGVYRRGDFYLRSLQRASSVPFGTRTGRLLTLALILPALGSFVLLEGAFHLVGPVLRWLGLPVFDPRGWLSFLVTAACILVLVHSAFARSVARQLLDALGWLLAWVFFRVPRAVFSSPVIRRSLARPIVRRSIRRGLIPALIAGAVYFLVPIPAADVYVRALAAFGAFALVSAAMGSRLGWWFEDLFVDHLAPTWQALSRHWFPQTIRLIGRAFAKLMDGFERSIQYIDDALRFRRTRIPWVLGMAAVAGTVWSAIAYVIRLYITLLVEPELNPLKHFPVVTVAHKVLLPFTPELMTTFGRLFSILGSLVGPALAGVTVFLLPSVFGFLVWELKENYRLYRSTRPPHIPVTRLGPSGETMRGLLVPGIHSGTLPKLYERLRRAARRYEESAGAKHRAEEAPELGRFREGLRAVERSIRRFVERELLAALTASPRWRVGPVQLARIDLSSNRIRLHLECPTVPEQPLEILFEQLGGKIIAGVENVGFLQRSNATEAQLFENVLAVFYHHADVDLVRQQLERVLGSDAHYDVVEARLLVNPQGDSTTELSYKLELYRPGAMRPSIHGTAGAQAPTLDSREVLYTHQPVSWTAWEHAWTQAIQKGQAVPRLLAGPSLLPTELASPPAEQSTPTPPPSERATVRSEILP